MFFPKIKYTSAKRLRQLERDIGSLKYKTWRHAVLERDNNRCQWPSCIVTRDLQVHHIKRWADAINLRYNVYNGITLCKDCHKKIQGKEAFYEVTFLKRVLANDKLWQQLKNNRDNPLVEGTDSVEL